MAETIEKKPAAKPAVKVAAKKPAVRKPAVIKNPAAKPAAAAPAGVAVKEPAAKKTEKYYEAVGRRKTATARVRLYTKGDKEFMVNGHPFGLYFKGAEFKNVVESPLVKMNCTDRFRVTAVVKGGGVNAQAEALRHGITRALVLFNADFKKRLKKSGYLTRDPRMKERKKPGLKKARRAPQWAKR
jgi:small subunit ribosomal protein S9